MKPTLLYVIALTALTSTACQGNEATGATSAPEAPSAPAVAADNTDKNERDRGDKTLTPMDQSESAADRTITQQIRQGVVGADEVSAGAKNVKIITVDGVVTLRGPVENVTEKTSIAALAKKVEGVKRVDNQLEVAAK
jgi:osmotically-inducible protein OsmY